MKRKAPDDSSILLEEFSNPKGQWKVDTSFNRRGGDGNASFAIENGIARFQGYNGYKYEQAGGFKRVQTTSYANYSDVSHCQGLVIDCRSTVDYDGYLIYFLNSQATNETHGSGYIAKFTAPSVLTPVRLPFASFSAAWVHVQMSSADDFVCEHEWCPGTESLHSMDRMGLFAMDEVGWFGLEIQSIGAYECSTTELDSHKDVSSSIPTLSPSMPTQEPQTFSNASEPIASKNIDFNDSADTTEYTPPTAVLIAISVCCTFLACFVLWRKSRTRKEYDGSVKVLRSGLDPGSAAAGQENIYTEHRFEDLDDLLVVDDFDAGLDEYMDNTDADVFRKRERVMI